MNTVRTKLPDEKFCADCGELIKAKAEICPKCGVRQMPVGGTSNATSNAIVIGGKGKKDKTLAGLLAILLGGIGVHDFYLGRIVMGVLSVLFCWTFIPAIIGFIEGIWIFTLSDDQFDMRFNK